MPAAVDAPIRHDSDSEDDLDYVPEGEERDSDTDNERDTKRPRVENPPLAPEDLAAAKSERQVLWAKFQDTVNTPPSAPPESGPKRMVKIEKRHRFAGEDVVEVVDVPEDSADAKKWPLWKPTDDGKEEAPPTPSGVSGLPQPSTGDSPPAPLPPPLGPSSSSLSAETEAAAAAAPTPTTAQPPTTMPARARPGRRKPKLQLAELPSSSGGDSRKGLKRLTTLEKSALDWKAHVDAAPGGEAELASELEANRRGGGYLEKVEFLQRVDDRKNQTLEANKDHKRRRG